jgi:superoxide reductase
MSAEQPEKLFAGVNGVSDPSNVSDLEKKHLPVISAPKEVKADECFEITVEVGKLLQHPNEKKHFIQFIELYAGEAYLTRVDLTAETTCPVLKSCVALPKGAGPLVAYERCNLHGVWKSEVPITVK